MKYIIASLAIGACLILPSAEAVFAAQPGADCGDTAVGAAPGNSTGAVNPAGTNGSPFAADSSLNNFTKAYAGNEGNPTTTNGHANTAKAVSQYDIACANVSTKKSLKQTP